MAARMQYILTLLVSIDIYGDEFFASIDGVTNALDNIKARKFLTVVYENVFLLDIRQVCIWTSAVCSMPNPSSSPVHWARRVTHKSSCHTLPSRTAPLRILQKNKRHLAL